MSEEDGFMSNEKLYNMFADLSRQVNQYNNDVVKQIGELHTEMRKYNNMRDRVEANKQRLEKVEQLTLDNTLKISDICSAETGAGNQREKIAWVLAAFTSLVTILYYTGII